MEIGLPEILLIVAVIFVVLFAVRVVRTGQNTVEQGKPSTIEIPQRQVEQNREKGSNLKIAGIVFILVAVLLLIFGRDLLKMAMMSFTWAFVVLAIGLAILFMSREK